MAKTKRRWRRSPPDRNGWWRFREKGMSFDQVMLIYGGVVASDEEWQRATHRAPSDVRAENYWEGCDTVDMCNGTLTSGLWIFHEEAKSGED